VKRARGTQNGGSVAQRQFCRGRQNCAASDQLPNQPYHSRRFVSFVMRPVVTASLFAMDATADVSRRKHLLQSRANSRKFLCICHCLQLCCAEAFQNAKPARQVCA
jgi:hypothetical protein